MNSDHSGVHLAGRCRELVTIDGSEGDGEDYTEGSGIYLDGRLTSTWAVSGVRVTEAPWVGIIQFSGTLDLERVEVTENQVLGIENQYGTLVATDCLVQGNHELGLLVLSSSTATLQGVQVLGFEW